MSKASKAKHISATPKNGQQMRVFISYSHEDMGLVRILAEVLKNNHMEPIYDEGLRIGTGFKEEIINYISHAHIFLPLLTETSLTRPWVQQEIGYAVASRVQTVPVAINCEPGEFLHGIQAIQLKTMDKAVLRKRLTEKALRLCLETRPLRGALYECAETTDERAMMLAEYAETVTQTGGAGLVRQLGGLSSFHIPDENINHPLWQQRYGKQHQPMFHRKVLLEERRALTEHAKKMGCRIIIDPDLTYDFYGGNARRTRLECLLHFLQGLKAVRCDVAMTNIAMSESITIVGDWFAARSILAKMGDGYRQTIFTRHAPTIASMIEEFDSRFDQCFYGSSAVNSRERAIKEIQRRVAELYGIPAKRTKSRK